MITRQAHGYLITLSSFVTHSACPWISEGMNKIMIFLSCWAFQFYEIFIRLARAARNFTVHGFLIVLTIPRLRHTSTISPYVHQGCERLVEFFTLINCDDTHHSITNVHARWKTFVNSIQVSSYIFSIRIISWIIIIVLLRATSMLEKMLKKIFCRWAQFERKKQS